jgi:hypothetical protein
MTMSAAIQHAWPQSSELCYSRGSSGTLNQRKESIKGEEQEQYADLKILFQLSSTVYKPSPRDFSMLHEIFCHM